MALESNIVVPDLFAGDDKVLEFEIFEEGQDPENPTALMEDVSLFTMSWSLRRSVRGVALHRQIASGAPLVEKVSGAGIEVIGSFSATRAENTQRVRVRVDAADLAGLDGGLFVHALKRTDVGSRTTLSYGTVSALVPA
jgi:hypothetical protein